MLRSLIIAQENKIHEELCKSLTENGLVCSITPYDNRVTKTIASQKPNIVLLEMDEQLPDNETRELIQSLKKDLASDRRLEIGASIAFNRHSSQGDPRQPPSRISDRRSVVHAAAPRFGDQPENPQGLDLCPGRPWLIGIVDVQNADHGRRRGTVLLRRGLCRAGGNHGRHFPWP